MAEDVDGARTHGDSRASRIRAHPDADLSRDQLQTLHALLTGKRRELAAALEALNQQIVAKEDCSLVDTAEAASLREEVARAAGIAQQQEQTLAEIDGALRRLEQGRYGVSEVTGEPIPYERLLLIPWARSRPDDETV